MEKVYRAYSGKVHPVLDIVRSTIISSSIKEAHHVLKVVLGNSNVHVIKNRLDTAFDSKRTAGYRDLNWQTTFPEAVGTPFEGFVCELQIHLKVISELKKRRRPPEVCRVAELERRLSCSRMEF